jgi:hypothetical protein
MTKCPENCTTKEMTGSYTPFACKLPDEIDNDSILQMQSTIIVLQSQFTSSMHGMECKSLSEDISLWLEHGVIQNCYIDILGSSHGTVSCIISTSPCIASYMVSWISSKFKEKKSIMTNSIFDCLQLDIIDHLNVGNPIVSIQTNSEIKLKDRDLIKRTIPINDPPKVIREPYKWYLDKDQTLMSIGLFYVLILSLVLSTILVCTLCFFNIQRKKIIQNLFDEMQKGRKKFKQYIG